MAEIIDCDNCGILFKKDMVDKIMACPLVKEYQKFRKKVDELTTAGLHVDGSHHKQWVLEEIWKIMNPDQSLPEDIEKGIAP